jgi:hypothetical protein
MTVAIEALSKIIRHASPAVAREGLADVANDFERRVKDRKGMYAEGYGKLILHGAFQVQRGVDERPREVRELYPYMFI